jgi:hypothetical protein
MRKSGQSRVKARALKTFGPFNRSAPWKVKTRQGTFLREFLKRRCSISTSDGPERLWPPLRHRAMAFSELTVLFRVIFVSWSPKRFSDQNSSYSPYLCVSWPEAGEISASLTKELFL